MESASVPSIMEETTIIIQNADGTILLATQPHLKKRKVLECWKCTRRFVYKSGAKFVKCCYCNEVNKVVTRDENRGLIVNCIGCNTSLKTDPNAIAVNCPVCTSITPIRF